MTSFLGESIPGILAENKGEPVTGQCLSADTSRHVTRKVLSLLENHNWRLSEKKEFLICKFLRAARVHGNKSYCAAALLLNSFVSNRC